MDVVNNIFKDILNFAHQHNLDFLTVIKIIDLLIIDSEVNIENDSEVDQFLNCQRATNSVLRMLPMSQYEKQYKLFMPAYSIFKEQTQHVLAYKKFKLDNYKKNYPDIVKLAEEYKRILSNTNIVQGHETIGNDEITIAINNE